MDTPDSTTKQCTKCKAWFPATPEYFIPHKGKLYCQCHACRKQAKKDSHVRNRDHNNARTKRWADTHREERKAYVLEYVQRPEVAARLKAYRERYYIENRERIIQRTHDWYYADLGRGRAAKRSYHRHNPDVARANAAVRRAREKGAPGRYTAADVRKQYAAQKGKCWWCGKRVGDTYVADHLIPLSRGGTNEPRNIVIACPKCNGSKHDKLPQEWIGRLF